MQNRNPIREAARLKIEAGLKTVQPAIAKNLKLYEDFMIPIYQDIAERLGLSVDGNVVDLASEELKDE